MAKLNKSGQPPQHVANSFYAFLEGKKREEFINLLNKKEIPYEEGQNEKLKKTFRLDFSVKEEHVFLIKRQCRKLKICLFLS